MNIIYSLFVVFVAGTPGVEMHYYNTLEQCEAAAKAYTSPYCVPINADGPIYGNCWACMHGCTWQDNIKYCAVDPRPRSDAGPAIIVPVSTGECVDD